MAGRIRTVKPEWLEDDIALENSDVRVVSIGLLLVADDHGRGRATDQILGSAIFPGNFAKIRECLARLSRLGFVQLYQVRDQRYFRIVHWTKHQRVDRPGRPRVPCVCGENHSAGECPRENSRESRVSLATDPDLIPHTNDPDPDHIPPASERLEIGQSKHSFDFESVYLAYPRKVGKKTGLAKCKTLIRTEADFDAFAAAVDAMAAAWRGQAMTYCPHFSTFVSQERWRDGELPLPAKRDVTTGRCEPRLASEFTFGKQEL